jgi:hypothetical protein
MKKLFLEGAVESGIHQIGDAMIVVADGMKIKR